MEKEYTVIMSVYNKVLPEYLVFSINSVLEQTLLPKKFIIVKDGPLTEEQEKVLNPFFQEYMELFDIIKFDNNQGCGPAYNEALKHCNTKYAMIMDSDDYIVPEKNKKQLNYLLEHQECDMVGSSVSEFLGDISNVISFRKMPCSNNEIHKFAHKRCPMAQPTVMFKVKSVIDAGSYQKSQLTEDYDLYIRMILNKCKFYNFSETLTYMRVNEDFYARRGGLKYLNLILKFKYKWYKKGFFSLKEFIITGGSSLIVALMPNKLRTFVYEKLLRK